MIQAVVINLKRHQDRLAWFLNNARKVNLSVERIDAVDVHDKAMQLQIDDFLQTDSVLSRAEAACFLSHRNVWKKLVDSQEKFVAVFEDDVHLSMDVSQLLMPNLVPEGVGLIKLEYPLQRVSYVQKRYATYLGRNLHRLLTNAYGSAGYIISRDCARYALEVTKTYNRPVDCFLFNPESVLWDKYHVLQVVPAICIQDDVFSRMNKSPTLFESTISVERKNMETIRQSDKEKRKKFFRNIKIPRYVSCVLNGANPLRYKDFVTLDLGNPSVKEQT
jgi:glycosyl transferase, family 25